MCAITNPYKGKGAFGGVLNNVPILCGGQNDDGVSDSCTKVGEKEAFHKMTTGRRFAASVVIHGSLWICGGRDGDANVLQTTEYLELLSPQQARSRKGPDDLPRKLAEHCMTRQSDNTVIITGGESGDYQALKETATYDFSTGTWINDSPSLNEARYGHGCATLASGHIIVAGGYDSNNDLLDSAEILNKGKWTRGTILDKDKTS